MSWKESCEEAAWIIRNLCGRLSALCRREGLASALRIALSRLWEGILLERRVACFEIPLSLAWKERLAPPGISYGRLQEEEIPLLARFSPHTSPGEIRRRLREGHICHVARDGQQIIFCGWAGGGRIRAPVLGKVLDLPPKYAYAYNIFTREDYRGRSLFPLFVSEMARALKASGFERCMTLVDLSTKIPISAYVRVTRAERMRVVRYRRFLMLIKRYQEREIPLKDISRGRIVI